MTYRNFYELEVYKECRKFRNEVSILIKNHFPKKEKYKLEDQLMKSSRSITANIAEGYGRFHHKENIQFCRIARGSLNETFEHLICAYDEKYISKEILNNRKTHFHKCLKLINGYIAYLKKQVNQK